MTAVKICGITNVDDAIAAVEFGATYIGFVLWPQSPRAATLETVRRVTPQLPAHITPVGVFVNPTVAEINTAAEAGIKLAQVHVTGNADLHAARVPVVPAVHLAGDGISPDVDDDLVVLDAHDPVKHGGTGRTIDWQRAAKIANTRHVILAGGLTPANVAEAIRTVRPFAVDVASGVEAAAGKKDLNKLRAFLEAALGTQASEAR